MKKIFLLGFITILGLAVFTRFYNISSSPPALYWEEVALGYDAYSILKTGKDHHGHNWPISAFESFGDYKPALYFYVVVPAVALLGLNEEAVRFPSAIAGLLIVIGTGLIARVFAKKLRFSPDIVQLLTMFVVSISPWAIQFSRAAWEVNLATCLVTWGVYLGLKAGASRRTYFISFGLLALSMYAYHATRLIAPFLAMGLLGLWLLEGDWKANLKKIFPMGIFFILLILPLLLSFRDPIQQQRFKETNLFSDPIFVEQSNTYREAAGDTHIARLLYHRYFFYGRGFIENYFKHFSPTFLFIQGDQNPRHSVQIVGQFYLLDAVFLSLGIFYLFKMRDRKVAFLFFWILIGVVPAGLTKAAPHALRILPVMPALLLILSFGVMYSVVWLKQKWPRVSPEILTVPLALFFLIQFGQFWRFYSLVFPQLYASEWQYGYKEMVAEVKKRQHSAPNLPVFITREQGRPAMYYWFYTKTDPSLVQGENEWAKKDQGEFLQFQNIEFVDALSSSNKGIIASSRTEFNRLTQQGSVAQEVSEVRDLQGKVVWVIYQLH